jgi:hypothetical protein
MHFVLDIHYKIAVASRRIGVHARHCNVEMGFCTRLIFFTGIPPHGMWCGDLPAFPTVADSQNRPRNVRGNRPIFSNNKSQRK